MIAAARALVLALCLVSALLAAAPPAAADDLPPGWFSDRRVRLLVFGDWAAGRPGRDFEDAMRDATLDDPYSPAADGRYVGGGDTPQSTGGRTGYGLALGYALSPRWEVRGWVRGEESLRAFGVRQVLYRVQLSVEESSTRYAAAVYHYPDFLPLRLGAGLALTSAEVKARDDWRQFATNVDSRAGFVLDGGITWPRHSRLFADAGVQYWYAGDMSYGPYNVRNGIGNIQVYFPRRAYSLDRLTASVGVGFRL